MQIAVNDAGGNLGDFPDMRAEGFPACLFGQPLRDRDQRYEDDSGDQARDAESGPIVVLSPRVSAVVLLTVLARETVRETGLRGPHVEEPIATKISQAFQFLRLFLALQPKAQPDGVLVFGRKRSF